MTVRRIRGLEASGQPSAVSDVTVVTRGGGRVPRDRAAGSSALGSCGLARACATRHAGLRTRLL